MDGYQNRDPDYPYNENYRQYQPRRRNGIGTAALILGVLSLVGMLQVLPAYLFGGTAVVLALLSRGRDERVSGSGKIGLILGTVSMAVITLMAAAGLWFILTHGEYKDEFFRIYRRQLEEIYGEEYVPSEDDPLNFFFSDGEDP